MRSHSCLPLLSRAVIGALLLLGIGLTGFGSTGSTAAAAEAKGAAPAQPLGRPFIWVRNADRAEIVAKLKQNEWGNQQFQALRARARVAMEAHKKDRVAYLKRLPLVEKAGLAHPTFAPITDDMASTGRAHLQTSLQKVLNEAVDCGVLHYLTGNRDYAATAADTLQAIVRALRGIPPSTNPTNGGWLYTGDHLYEARLLGAQLPIIYDFVASYVHEEATKVWDLPSGQPVRFAFADAQEVFRTYARLAVEHGMSDSNWPLLEMPSLAHNALALDDPAERAHWLSFVTHVDVERHDPLDKVLADFRRAGGVWPESFQYANEVAKKVTYIVSLLRRQQPAVPLPEGILDMPRSVLRMRDFRFPNGQFTRFGDGPRRASPPYSTLEFAYALSAREGLEDGMREYGGILADAMKSGAYTRGKLGALASGANVYLEPLSILWFAPEIAVPATPAAQAPVTDHLPFAGLVIQRNLAPDRKPLFGLMAAVSGASYIHSAASGMALELYGLGHVLGANAGKGTYRSEEHENYRRLFAAANTVIVNGAAQSSGGWVNLGTDTVKPVALEPARGATAVSPHHSFTVTHFQQNHGAATPAEQERLVGIVRTSPTSGFYVDVFRSRTTVPGAQFHDYLYHNFGDELKLAGAAGERIPQKSQAKRFQPIPGAKWVNNRSFLFPGWHYFEETRVSEPRAQPTRAEFFVNELKPKPVSMRVHFSEGAPREYATALAPETKEAASPYDKKQTPVLVVRQQGEAWTHPFAAIFEPMQQGAADRITRTASLQQGEAFAGLAVQAVVGGQEVSYHVIIPPDANVPFTSDALGLSFQGRYAVITTDAAGQLLEAYVGEGTSLVCRGHRLVEKNGASFAAWLNLRAKSPQLQAGDTVIHAPAGSGN